MKFINREISWLSFNERVLQEAEDLSVPLIERIRFLGIFSNNRDEFFRVRVATLERLSALGKSSKSQLDYDPESVLSQIQEIVLNQERKFGKIYKALRKELVEHDIYIVGEDEINEEQGAFVKTYFENDVRGTLVPLMISKKHDLPRLKDNAIYLAVKLHSKNKKESSYSIIEIPSLVLNRFLVLPSVGNKKYVMLLDDIIRYNLEDIYHIFEFSKLEAYTFKITRDAELDIDDDLSTSWIDKLTTSLKERKTGDPVRFVYDEKMPKDLLSMVLKKLRIKNMDHLSPGARYHNFKDFMDFPDVGAKNLRNKKLKPNDHPSLKNASSIIDVVMKKDVLLSYPYQSFHYIVDLLREAAIDPNVNRIQINLYRVAKRSKIINALINAARNGKEVVVVLELTARFDEENNIKWSHKLQDEGVKIIHGVPGLKVHSKLILIDKKSKNGKLQQLAHIGTGNFHEGTANLYGDHSLLTADPKISAEVSRLFDFFEVNYKRPVFRHLVVSPFNVRRRLNLLINNEIRNAKKGKKAQIILKLNNLVDETLIKKLYEASAAGVKIKLMVRGICSLVPEAHENIEAYSIVDRFLEHARVMVFHNGGNSVYLLGSADWMTRNVDHRVEVLVPIYDKDLKNELRLMLEIQFKDNVKRRILDKKLSNQYASTSEVDFRSQIEQYKYFKSLVK